MEQNNPFSSLNMARKNLATHSLDSMKEDLLKQHTPSSVDSMQQTPTVDLKGIFSKQRENKIDLNPREIDQRDVYKQVGDELVSRYDNYIPNIDNNEYHARRQSTAEKWGNGLTKLGLKTGSAVVGGTAGFVSGVFNAIKEGSVHAMYTDDFNVMIDEYNEKLDLKLPNYYTEQERDLGLIDSMGTANFWANDVTGGLSFTLGMMVSEGIWAAATGGTSLIAKGALSSVGRWSSKAMGANKSLKGIQKWKAPTKELLNKSTFKALDEAPSTSLKSLSKTTDNLVDGNALKSGRGATIAGSQVAKSLNQARFIATSAGYEAGVEARHYMKEMQDEWMMNFQEENGRNPDQEELSEFFEETNGSANAVFGANLALVGGSNMAVFGKMLLGKTAKAAPSNSWLKRELFGTGFNLEKGTATALKANKAQKIAGKAYSILRAPVIEGVWEEGGQSIAAKSVKDYVLDGFDKDSTESSLSMMDSIIEGLNQTYGTKEGRKEIGIGMIIGLFGGGVTTKGRFNNISQERKNIDELTSFRNEYKPERVLATQITAERMKANNRIIKANEKAEQSRANGDLTGEYLSEQQAVLASVERDSALQGRKQGISDFEAYLNTVSDSELAEELGMENAEEAREWKQQKFNEYKETSDRYEDNERYVRALVGENEIAGLEKGSSTEHIIKALTYNLTIGEQSKEFTTKLVNDIKTAIAGEVSMAEDLSALDIDQVLATSSREAVDNYMNLSKQQKDKVAQRTKIENELVTKQYNTNPTNPEAHKKSLQKLQGDIIKLDEQISEIEQNKDVAFRALGINDEAITTEDLDAQAERVQSLQEKVEGYKDNNPQLYNTLTKLFSEYNKSKSNTANFNKVAQELSDPQIRVRTINGWLSGILNKNRTLDESTSDFFRTQIEQYDKNRTQGKTFSGEALNDRVQAGEEENTETTEEGDEMIVPDTEDIEVTDDIYNEFVDNGNVPQPVLQSIAKKVSENTELTDSETDIFNDKTSEINDILKTSFRGNLLTDLKNKIKEIMNDNVYTTSFIGEDYEEAVKTKPSEEDVNRYNELLGKVNNNYITNYNQLLIAPKGYFKNNNIETGLTTTELEELKGLQNKLSNWKVLEGSMDSENNSIADLLLYIEQLETQVEKADTKQEVTENEYETIRQASDKDANDNFETSEAVQSPDQVVVRVVKDTKKQKVYSFSHLDVTSLTRLFPNSTLEVVQGKKSRDASELTSDAITLLSKKEGQEFRIVTPEGTIQLRVGKRSRLNFNKKDLDSLIENSNIVITNYGSGNFVDVYERLSNGDLIPLKGDFSYESTLENEIIELLPEVVNNIKEGQILTTRINKNDKYNKAILDKYNKSKKTEDDLNELMNNLHVYITDQEGNLVGSLRASQSDLNNTEASKNLLELRRKSVEMVLDENNTDNYFKLNEVIPTRTVLIGSPNLVIRDGKPQAIDFTDTALENVEDVGYLEGDTLHLRSMDSGKVIKTFLPKNTSQKIPVVIVKSNGKNVAFPVSLKFTVADKTAQVNQINQTDLSPYDKAIRINKILIESGLRPADFNTESGIDINRVLEALSEVQEFPNVVNWVDSSFNIESLQTQAQIAIDLDNKPFHLSKVMLDLSKTRTVGRSEQARNKYDNLERREIKLREDLQSAVGTILGKMNEYPDVDDVRWTNSLFAEDELYRNPESDVERRHNINLMRKALYNETGKKINPPKAVREAYGDDFLNNLRENIEALDRVIESKKKTRAVIKNAQLKNQTNKQNTPC